MIIKIKDCIHNGSCYNCKENCTGAGDIGADCPKYRCDRPGPAARECETCAFIKKFIKDVYGEEIQ